MAKKTPATETADVDDLLGGADVKAEKPAAKKAAKAVKAEPAAPAKKAKAAAPAPAAKKAAAAPAKKAKAAPAEEEAAPTSEVKIALAKVKKAISYADFSEKNGFNIRTVRRAAREMRDAGEIQLTRDGQSILISAAV